MHLPRHLGRPQPPDTETWRWRMPRPSDYPVAQACRAGFSTSSHHCRKLVGLAVSVVRTAPLSRPSSFARIMSTIALHEGIAHPVAGEPGLEIVE